MDDIRKLETGMYKVKYCGENCRLRITRESDQRFYQLGKVVAQPINEFDPDTLEIKVLHKISEGDLVTNAELVLRWQDGDLTRYELAARSTKEFRKILDDNPDVFAVVNRNSKRR